MPAIVATIVSTAPAPFPGAPDRSNGDVQIVTQRAISRLKFVVDIVRHGDAGILYHADSLNEVPRPHTDLLFQGLSSLLYSRAFSCLRSTRGRRSV